MQPIVRRIHGRNALVISKRGGGADDPSRTVLKKLRMTVRNASELANTFPIFALPFPSPNPKVAPFWSATGELRERSLYHVFQVPCTGGNLRAPSLRNNVTPPLALNCERTYLLALKLTCKLDQELLTFGDAELGLLLLELGDHLAGQVASSYNQETYSYIRPHDGYL